MAWNHMDNTYFFPASYLEHMIGRYSSVTDAVICIKSITFWVVYNNWPSNYVLLLCSTSCLGKYITVICLPMFLKCIYAGLHIILYSYLLGSWRGSLYPLLYWEGHWIVGLIDPGGQWFLGYSDQGSINPRTEWPGGYSIGGSLKPMTPACCHGWRYKLSSCKKKVPLKCHFALHYPILLSLLPHLFIYNIYLSPNDLFFSFNAFMFIVL